MTDHERLLPLLLLWATNGDRRAFRLEYGYGVSEEPILTLLDDLKPVWAGTLPEFLKWGQS